MNSLESVDLITKVTCYIFSEDENDPELLPFLKFLPDVDLPNLITAQEEIEANDETRKRQNSGTSGNEASKKKRIRRPSLN